MDYDLILTIAAGIGFVAILILSAWIPMLLRLGSKIDSQRFEMKILSEQIKCLSNCMNRIESKLMQEEFQDEK